MAITATTLTNIKTIVEGRLDRKIRSALPATFYNDLFYQIYKEICNRISEECKIPRATFTTTSSASQSTLTLPDGDAYSAKPLIYGGIRGIISLYFDGRPLERGYLKDLEFLYGEDYLNPTTLEAPTYYVEYDDPTKVRLIPAIGSGDADKTWRMIYVQEVPVPTAMADTLPREFEPFRQAIENYITGFCMDIDKEGRGAALMSAAETYIARQVATRRKEKRTVNMSVTEKLRAYNRNYGR